MSFYSLLASIIYIEKAAVSLIVVLEQTIFLSLLLRFFSFSLKFITFTMLCLYVVFIYLSCWKFLELHEFVVWKYSISFGKILVVISSTIASVPLFSSSPSLTPITHILGYLNFTCLLRYIFFSPKFLCISVLQLKNLLSICYLVY